VIFQHRLILLATPRQIGVLDWRPGRLHWLGEFEASTTGLAAFRAVIVRHARQPMLLVADTVDEDYRSETLPHVQGRARDELLARKLRQVFRNARFTGAWRQSRETSGRRDDRYLLATLTDGDWLVPWLSVLHREQAPLYGITPMAMACQHLLARLRVHEQHVLLACRFGSGLRLSYYQDGVLRFSRLIGTDASTPLAGNAADEIAKTQLYLAGQRILPREARLHVLLLSIDGELDHAQAPLNADPAFSARTVGVTSLTRALHIPEDFLAATPEVAPLAAIAGEPLQLNLAPPDLLRRHTEFGWRRGLHLATAGIALVGVGLSAGYWLHAQSLHEQAQRHAAEAARADAREAALARELPALGAQPQQLAPTLALAARLGAAPLDLPRLYALVGQALDAHPDVSLRALTRQDRAPGRADLTVEAQLAEFDGNYRAAMARIDSFAARLAASPGVIAVERVVSPVDTAPTATLTGKTSGDLAPEDTRFSLRVQVQPS
jgi:hypothetical protein